MTNPAFSDVPSSTLLPNAHRPKGGKGKRHEPLPLHAILPHPPDGSPLLWGIDAELVPPPLQRRLLDLEAWIREGTRTKKGMPGRGKSRQAHQILGEDWREKISDWLAGVDAWFHESPDQRSGQFVLTGLAWCHALPLLDAIQTTEVTERLHRMLQRIAREPMDAVATTNPWTFHLLGELGFTLAHYFPHDPVDGGLREPSRESLTHGICELTDGEGQVHVRHLPWMLPLLASWTRSESLARADAGRGSCFLQEGEDQFRWFVQQVLRWMRRDGYPLALAGGPREGTGERDFWHAVLDIQDEPATQFLAATMLPKRWGLTDRRDAPSKEGALPNLSMVAEWAELAILRTNWERNAAQLAVTFANGKLRSELTSGKRVIWSGDSLPRVRVNSQELVVQGEADLTCTFSDEDAEYVELEFDLGSNWRLQRQMLLGRGDNFLLLADALLGPETATIEYAHTLPLTKEVEFRGEDQTHEGWLVQGDRPVALVLPLGLPEWRASQGSGTLSSGAEGVTLSHQVKASHLFAPLFIDLGPKRNPKPHTWRQLTVAESLKIQPPDVAVGYRVQIGKTQWVIYRSLQAPALRTILGQHFSQEFVMGRFRTDGQVDQILQIS